MNMRRLNPFRKRNKKQKSLGRRVAKALLVPCIVFFAVLTVYWSSQEFWVYVQMLLWNEEHDVDPDYYLHHGLDDGSWTPPDDSGQGSSKPNGGGGGSSLGGVNLALMNNISGSYCGDWLLIARDHANKTNMNPDVKWANGMECPIVYLTGAAMKESDLQQIKIGDKTVGVPNSNINIKDYEYGKLLGDTKYTLYVVNSKWFNENGFNFIDPKYTNDMKDGTYYSVFQMQRDFLAIVPKSGSQGWGARYPSTLNGYGIAEGTVRGTEEGDYGFFPDQVSAAIQSGWSRLEENKRTIGLSSIDLNSPIAAGVAYAMHNAGQGNFPSWFGFGRKNSINNDGVTWNDSVCSLYPELAGSAGTDLGGQLTADAINRIVDAGERILEYIVQNPDTMSDSDYTNRAVFEGMTAAAAIYGCNGFVDTNARNNLANKASTSTYCKGFAIAYTAITGSSMSDSEVPGVISSLDVSYGDGLRSSGYYDLYKGKFEGTTPTIYTEDSSHNFTASDGTSHKFVHAYVEEPTSGLLWVPIGGTYLYWKMLQYAGVDCDFSEVLTSVSDGGSGDLLDELPTYVAGATEVGERIARRAIMMSWPQADSADIAEATWGNALYLCTYWLVTDSPWDPWTRSCDAFAQTAVKWGGGDDNYPEHRATLQRDHCAGSQLWREIPYDMHHPNLSDKMPGDVVFSEGDSSTSMGHVMIYVGNDLIKEYFPDAPDSWDLCHASLRDRSSKCASFLGYNSWYVGKHSGRRIEFWRTTGMDTSKYVNILSDKEIQYLYENKTLLGDQHYTSSSSKAPVVDKPNIS